MIFLILGLYMYQRFGATHTLEYGPFVTPSTQLAGDGVTLTQDVELYEKVSAHEQERAH